LAIAAHCSRLKVCNLFSLHIQKHQLQ
jgi:hypothetical protein